MDLYYPPTKGTSNSPFVATVKASILSCLPAQQRFQIRGTKGSFVKYGVDPQEAHLKKVGSSTNVRGDYGVETESTWGTLFEARKPADGEESIKNADGTEFVAQQ